MNRTRPITSAKLYHVRLELVYNIFMDQRRYMACRILGVSEWASLEEIKKAYKNLAKRYHPDVTGSGDEDHYKAIVEAYDYLCKHPVSQEQRSRPLGKILGTETGYYKDSSYKTFEKRYQKQKEKRREELERRTKALHDKVEKEKRQKEQYDKAMEAIYAIRAANLIKSLIHNVDTGNKDEK